MSASTLYSTFFIRPASVFLKGFFCVVALLIFCKSTLSQDQIDSRRGYLNFLSSISEGEAGLILMGNDRCGQCLMALDSTYLEKLDSALTLNYATVDSDSEFGQIISMKYRINKLPAILFLDNNGQLLRKMFYLPLADHEINSLKFSFDTLPPFSDPLFFDLEYPKFLKDSYEPSTLAIPDDEVLNSFFQMKPNLKDEVVWAVTMRFDISENIANQIMADRDTLVALFGKDEVYRKLDKHFFGKMKSAARDRSESQLQTTLSQARLVFGKDEFDYTSKYRSYFYQLTGDWDAYLELGNEIKAKASSSQALTEMALVLLKHSNNEESLRSAAKWFSEEMSERDYQEADLKTLLLWRAGDAEQAEKLASRIEALPIYSIEKFPYTSLVLKELE